VSSSDPYHRGDTVALHQAVIVGIDGSAPSEEAAAWALKELRRSGRTLNLVHVITPASPESAAESELRSAGDEVLTRLSVRLAHLDAAHPDGASDTTIDTEVVIGDPAEALSALASDASLLVLGHHGVGQGNSPRLGTVSFDLPCHALSSVLVHRVRTGSAFDDTAAHPTMRSGSGQPPTTVGSDALVDAVPADDGNARRCRTRAHTWSRRRGSRHLGVRCRGGSRRRRVRRWQRTASARSRRSRGIG